MPKAYFIQYKFIIPKSIKHSSYTYQKLFRAIYGYTQTVCKSSGKIYRYQRKGILSNYPYLRPGKNCVIIPTNALQDLKNFFLTGKNPTHYWHVKGDWKATYYMDEKDVSEEEAIKAVEELLDRTFIISSEKEPRKLSDEIALISQQSRNGTNPEENYKKALLADAQILTSAAWFKECSQKSGKLSEFVKELSSLGRI